MRFLRAAAACCSAIGVSAQGFGAWPARVGHLETEHDISTVGVTNANSTEAAKRYVWDFREDVPAPGQHCTPSTMWAKNVDPTKYEIGCTEIEELLRGPKTFAGRGNVREVYIAQYKGRSVALKLLITRSVATLHEHWVELVTTDAVQGQPHVVDMLGFCETTVVTEVYSKDAKKVVRQAQEPLSMNWVVSMSLDAAIGLRALHEAIDAPIVHFDVKLSQLLIQENGRVKLADYNLAYFMGISSDGSPCHFNKKSPTRNGNGRKSPEYASGKPMTEKVDIYRMGLVYAALITAGRGSDFNAKNGDLPVFNASWHQGYVKIVQDMLAEAEQRPSAGEVVARLQTIQQELSHTP
ncbi:unnamed protein product [Scytosiphon promiscuus]